MRLGKEYAPGEEKFYIDYLLAEWRFIEQEMSLEQAIEKANRVERAERAKSNIGRLAKFEKIKARKKIYKKKLNETFCQVCQGSPLSCFEQNALLLDNLLPLSFYLAKKICKVQHGILLKISLKK